jgi:hypothetical protein
MKFKNLLLASLAIFGITSLAQAQQTVVITGSSAYRTSVDAALLGLGFNATTQISGKTSATGNAATYTASSGTYNGWTVKTSWSGSAAGIQTVAATSPTKTVGVFADGVTGNQSDPRALSTGNATQVRPDIAFADNAQSSTKFNGSFLGTTYTSLTKASVTVNSTTTQPPVGVVGFVFALSKSASTTYAMGNDTINMTSQAAQNIWSLGYGPLAMLTGNSSDRTTTLVAAGRDPDSGTRIVTLAETGIGASSTIQQYLPVAPSGNMTSLALYPAATINGVPVPEGESGESSGSGLASLMGNLGPVAGISPSGNAGMLVGYLSSGDAATITGGVRCLYNGVAYSTANIQEGKYTLWGYEYCFYRPDISTSGSPNKKSFADALATRIYTTDASIRIPTMQVGRSVDGGTVGPTY